MHVRDSGRVSKLEMCTCDAGVSKPTVPSKRSLPRLGL